MGSTRVNQVEFTFLDCIIEPEFTLLAIVGTRISFEDYDFPARSKGLCKYITRHFSSGAVVGAHKSQVNAGLLLRPFIQCDVDIDNDDAGLDCPRQRWNQSTRVRRSDYNRVHLLGYKVLDGIDLRIDVGFRMHSYRHQREVTALLRVFNGSFFHVFKELICQLFHYESDN